ncbi:hypothetical protein H2200_000586 [Cladophialophora chaetospira]|uniref:Uncharacterized protein n=1 Tax=Cladophialophora chaetospira TaxID=386627 RepID=A0AA38XPJ3_9EURO|nr:hypothetical protein H2200_000586 [Cladophialophora chaetospira]
MSHDPANSLIIFRLHLIEKFEQFLRQRPSNTRTLHLTSLVPRLSDSGHIKSGEGYPAKITFSECIQRGLDHRKRFVEGNKRWGFGNRPRFDSPYERDNDPEPHAILRKKMKTRAAEGVEQAKVYEHEFGLDYIYKPATAQELQQEERVRLMKRTHPGAFDRRKVIDALTMLRNTYPVEYEAALAEIELAKRNQVNRKVKAAKVSAPMPSPETRPESPPGKEVYRHSNESNLSFASFVSADTFGAQVKTVKKKAGKLVTAFKKAASKVPGLRHKKGEENLREHLAPHSAESLVELTADSPSPFEQALRRVGIQDKPDRISEWTGIVEYQPGTALELDGSARMRDSTYIAYQPTDTRSSREFTIDAGAVESPTSPANHILIAKSFVIDAGLVLPPTSPIEELYNHAAASVEDLTIIVPPCHQVEHSNIAELSATHEAPVAELPVPKLPVAEMPVAELPSDAATAAPAPVEVKMRKRDRFRGRFTFGARL